MAGKPQKKKIPPELIPPPRDTQKPAPNLPLPFLHPPNNRTTWKKGSSIRILRIGMDIYTNETVKKEPAKKQPDFF